MTELKNAIGSPRRTPRSGAIELLQVFSLLAFAAAWALHLAGATLPYPFAAIVLGVILFWIPFLLLRVSAPHRHPLRPRGFKITRERRRTLTELLVPLDILLAIDESILDINYETDNELREALYFVLGEERVRPWSDTILLHAKVHGDSPEPANEEEIGSHQGRAASATWRR